MREDESVYSISLPEDLKVAAYRHSKGVLYRLRTADKGDETEKAIHGFQSAFGDVEAALYDIEMEVNDLKKLQSGLNALRFSAKGATLLGMFGRMPALMATLTTAANALKAPQSDSAKRAINDAGLRIRQYQRDLKTYIDETAINKRAADELEDQIKRTEARLADATKDLGGLIARLRSDLRSVEEVLRRSAIEGKPFFLNAVGRVQRANPAEMREWSINMFGAIEETHDEIDDALKGLETSCDAANALLAPLGSIAAPVGATTPTVSPPNRLGEPLRTGCKRAREQMNEARQTLPRARLRLKVLREDRDACLRRIAIRAGEGREPGREVTTDHARLMRQRQVDQFASRVSKLHSEWREQKEKLKVERDILKRPVLGDEMKKVIGQRDLGSKLDEITAKFPAFIRMDQSMSGNLKDPLGKTIAEAREIMLAYIEKIEAVYISERTGFGMASRYAEPRDWLIKAREGLALLRSHYGL